MQENTQTASIPPQEPKKRDIAGDMARTYINSPITPLFIIIGFVIGIMGLMLTPRQEDPQVAVPMVDIFLQYPGASNQQVEALVSEPLQRFLKEIAGVENVFSASSRGQAVITAQFYVGENMEKALVNAYSKIASNMDLMPEGVLPPLVKPKGADDVPLVTFTLSSREIDSTQLRLLGFDVLQSLASIKNTAQGFIVGGEPAVIKVKVDTEKLAGYDISLTQIGHAIRAANAEINAGTFSAMDQEFRVYTGDFLTSAEDVENLIVGVKNRAPVFVRDIATVVEEAQDPTNLVKFYTGMANQGGHQSIDGTTAITIALAKQAGSNGVSVARDVIARLNILKGTIIPDNVHVAITRDYGQSANDKVNNLIFKLFIATGAVTLLIWLFLGWRAAAVVSVVIPIVILSTVFTAWILGMTIDRVSLFALIFSIGILVDDAVVVLENIYRRWLLEGDTSEEVTIEAVSEVGNPTIIATFAVIAALMPMAFVSGMMGPYMSPIPILGSVAMIVSLFAAFAFTPWLAQRLKPKLKDLKKHEEKERAQNEKLGNFFKTMIGSLLVNKIKGWGFLAGIFLAFAIAIYLIYGAMVPVKLLPFDNKPDISVVINFPEGTDLHVTANLAHKLAKTLQEEVPEVRTLVSYVGTATPFDFNGLVRQQYLRQFPWQADIQIQLSDSGDRARSSHEIAEYIRHKLTHLARDAGARIQIVEMPPGPPVLQSIVAEIYGPSEAVRNATAERLTAIFEEASLVVDVDNFITAPHDTWRFVISKQRAMNSGISVSTINQTVEMIFGDYQLGDVKQGFKRGEPTYIVIQVPKEIRPEFARIGQIPVQSLMGHTVPLGELGSFVLEPQQSVIFHKNLQPVQYVTATGEGRLGAPIYGMLEIQGLIDNDPYLQGLTGNFVVTPDGLTETDMIWAGEWTVTYETFRDMGLAFAVALLVIYMLVVWEFRNFVIPLIVMAPIPLTLIGIIPGHWIMGAEFTATSMIGFIALAGIIVRNSILLVDFARLEVSRGASVPDAVIYACKARTRPIVITAIALVLGSSVILFDPIFQGMAVSLIFGVLVATVLTLVVIPLGCVSARSAFQTPNNGTRSDPDPEPSEPSEPKPNNPVIDKDSSTRLPSIISVKTSIDPFKASQEVQPDVKKSSSTELVEIPDKEVKIEEKLEPVKQPKKPAVRTRVRKTIASKDSSDKTANTVRKTPTARKKRGIKLKNIDDE